MNRSSYRLRNYESVSPKRTQSLDLPRGEASAPTLPSRTCPTGWGTGTPRAAKSDYPSSTHSIDRSEDPVLTERIAGEKRMTTVSIEPPSSLAVSQVKLLHRVQRVATTLLVDAAQRDTTPSSALAELQSFLVTALLHYHQSEDDFLWPELITADPEAGTGLIELSAEHDALEAAVSTLDAVRLRTGRDRASLAAAAEALRNLLHNHLEHEESLLLPSLETHVSDEAWMKFSHSMIASIPPSCANLSLGFLEQVGTPAEFTMVTTNLSQSAQQLVPAMREQGLSILNSLR